MRVHAIVDDLDTARAAVAAGATVVQLRVKAPTAEIVSRGAGFRELAATFVVNDDDATFVRLMTGPDDADPGASIAVVERLLHLVLHQTDINEVTTDV